jgi:hypothetical protein
MQVVQFFFPSVFLILLLFSSLFALSYMYFTRESVVMVKKIDLGILTDLCFSRPSRRIRKSEIWSAVSHFIST